MLDSFWVAMQVVIPMGILMLLGVIIRRVGIVNRSTMEAMDQVTFRLFLPLLLFKNIYATDFSQGFDGKLVLGALGCMGVTFVLALLLPKRFEPDARKAAAVGQAIVHPNYILFGLVVAEAIYGEGRIGQVALLGVLVVPGVSTLGVVILELSRSGKADFGRIVRSIFKNPLVLGAATALVLHAASVRLPALVQGVVEDLAGVSTPLCFISLGVSMDLGELRHNGRSLALGVGIRMLLVPLLLLPVCVLLGFRGQGLCALMILCCAPAAVASYSMSVGLGADGQIAGQLVYCTTLVSVITIFLATFLFRYFGLL